MQLLRLRPAFDVAQEVVYAATDITCSEDVPEHRFYRVGDVSRWNWGRVAWVGLRLMYVIAREKPCVIITTGAAPGLVAVCLGRCYGAKTVWIDSIANVDEMSLSGRVARRFAHLALTQWEHLAGSGKKDIAWRGSVL